MRTLFALLLMLQAAPAGAFLFWGGEARREAEARLAEMRDARAAGDCQAVLGTADRFLEEKPPGDLREEAYGYMGECYELCGSADKAISLYKLAIELYPDNITFKSRLGAIYNRTGFPEHASTLFSAVLDSRPGDIAATLGSARAYAAMGFLSRAAKYYSKGVAIQDFSDESALKEYADCLLRKRDWGEALFIAQKGAVLSPLSGFWPRLKARVKAGQGDYRGAVSFMDKAIILSPGRRSRLERAIYLLLGGQAGGAIEASEAELSRGQDDPLASLVKGMALYSLGKEDDAAPYFRTASKGRGFTSKVAEALMYDKEKKGAAVCRR